MALSELAIRRAKTMDKDRILADGDGLYLFVPPTGRKAWHFRYYWRGKRQRMSFGTYPELSLRQARALCDEARARLAKGLNPRLERQRQAIAQVTEHTFMALYERWRNHRRLSLEDVPRGSLFQSNSLFKKDVFPVLKHLTVHEITRTHLLEILDRVEQRGALHVAEKLRTWFRQLFRYAQVVVPGLTENPAADLAVVALPLPPVEHNPFLRMTELPAMLQTLRKYRGQRNTQLGVRLLLLTGVRTGELRFATPDQFDLEQGLWLIPVARLKQRQQLKRSKHNKRNNRFAEIPPYIVPLSAQAQEIVRHLLDNFKPAQIYLFPGQQSLKRPISENTLNGALKRMGYEGLLTGHGIRATISTALNEFGYPKDWVDAQLSHADPNPVSSAYNHAEYVEQRRVMMQDWADRLDLFEQDHVDAASMPLTITLQGLPTRPGQTAASSLTASTAKSVLVIDPANKDAPALPPSLQRLSAVDMPAYAKPQPSALQRQRNQLLEIFEAPHNLRAEDYAKLVGKSRRWVSYEIQARHLLGLNIGHRGVRIPDWQLDPLKEQLVRTVLGRTSVGIDSWQIYHALVQPHELLDGVSPIQAVTVDNLKRVTALVCEAINAALWVAPDPTHAAI